MITGVVFLLIMAIVVLREGDLKRLAEIRPRMAWLVMGAVGVQFVIFTLLGHRLPFAVASALHLASYGMAILFVWFNRHIRGIILTVLGGVMNLVAIVANGGVMPASGDALAFAGKVPSAEAFENSGVQEDPKLLWLGDVFAFPEGMPFANVFSLGDIVLVIGGYVLISRQCLDEFRRDDDAEPVDGGDAAAGAGPETLPDDAPPPSAVEPRPAARPPGWVPDETEPGVQVWWTGAARSAFRTQPLPSGRRPGWYPDPWSEGRQRWWTGADWAAATTSPEPGQAARPQAGVSRG